MHAQVHREIARLMTQMRRLCALTVNKQLAVVGCSLHEYAVLFRLVHDAEVPQHELAYDAAIDPAAVSRLVRAMIKSGLVTTKVDPTDKRQRFVQITAKGRALERTLSPIIDAELSPLLAGLDGDEEQQFLGLFRKAYQHAVAVASKGDVPALRASLRTSGEDDDDEDVPLKGSRVRRLTGTP